jgi:replicative DNA helicase
MTKYKPLPWCFLAEEILLTNIIKNSKTIEYICVILPAEAFFLEKHQIIYQAALDINKNSLSVDLITISTWLQDNNLLDKIGGLETLINLSKKIVNFINLNQYIKLIKEKYIRRLLIHFGIDIIKLSFITNLSTNLIFSKINKKFYSLYSNENLDNFYPISEILADVLLNLDKTFLGYSSKFIDLNAITQGFQRSDLIVLAGRPSIGKTAFSLNLAFDICLIYKVPVIFFSLEMNKYQLIYRLLAIQTEITASRLKLKNLSQQEWTKFNDGILLLSSLPFYIADTPSISLTEIELKIQRIKLKFHTIGLIIIDYLQLIQTNKKSDNRVQEISQITRTLKKFAKEFDVPIIILSQLSRNVESRTNKRPILSDLRESGCIHFKYKEFLNFHNNRPYHNVFFFSKYFLQYWSYYNCQFTGFKPVFNLKTKFNLSILVTSNHKFIYQTFWLNLIYFTKICYLKVNLSLFFSKKIYKTILNEKIKKINYKGIKNVYDFEILKNKNFLKNGFILHNSIEQDADVVLMLYRDDYYNKEINEKKNIIEIIVSKHRNGPTGIVKLFFDNSLTKFFNYN